MFGKAALKQKTYQSRLASAIQRRVWRKPIR